VTTTPEHLHSFKTDVSGIELPEKFTFPFYYETHELAAIASGEIQEILNRNPFGHNFGLNPELEGTPIGKMFGVLVVETEDKELGYLAAFSGKVGNSNHHEGFVPPVFDMLVENSFFRVGEVELNNFTLEIQALEANEEIPRLKAELEELENEETKKVNEQKQLIQENRAFRAEKRNLLDPEKDKEQIEELNQASIADKLVLKNMQRFFMHKKNEINAELEPLLSQIEQLKTKRAEGSNALQQRLFDNYTFLNSRLENKSLSEIFIDSPLGIPAGAGECAAPKLLQYAYRNNLRPVALAEFWWGESPKSEIRVHGNYYPSCRGKCEPILGHMLEGITVDDNPLLETISKEVELPILYEDGDIMVVDKPAEMLSVPGKKIYESVYSRIKEMRPDAEGNLCVHRLDMSTSGCLLIAKNEYCYTKLQRQFIKRTVQKRYVALLDGIVKSPEGTIDLPLRVDLEDRPRQLVCYEHGSKAVTHYKVIGTDNGKTRIHFYPITGRTHQLRVHSAHSLGLNTPIVGDDLYGKAANRLHLHAEYLSFVHPRTKKEMKFNAPVPF
jgi:tRNA pseudouridine32 synthase / 23S rRNA pseudouridine746 synthase